MSLNIEPDSAASVAGASHAPVPVGVLVQNVIDVLVLAPEAESAPDPAHAWRQLRLAALLAIAAGITLDEADAAVADREAREARGEAVSLPDPDDLAGRLAQLLDVADERERLLEHRRVAYLALVRPAAA